MKQHFFSEECVEAWVKLYLGLMSKYQDGYVAPRTSSQEEEYEINNRK